MGKKSVGCGKVLSLRVFVMSVKLFLLFGKEFIYICFYLFVNYIWYVLWFIGIFVVIMRIG